MHERAEIFFLQTNQTSVDLSVNIQRSQYSLQICTKSAYILLNIVLKFIKRWRTLRKNTDISFEATLMR